MNGHQFFRCSKPPAAEATRLPSGAKATPWTWPVCPSKARSCSPVAASHMRTLLSKPPERICLPSGEKAALVTRSVWPRNRRSSLPVLASHKRRSLPSQDRLWRPSGERISRTGLPPAAKRRSSASVGISSLRTGPSALAGGFNGSFCGVSDRDLGGEGGSTVGFSVCRSDLGGDSSFSVRRDGSAGGKGAGQGGGGPDGRDVAGAPSPPSLTAIRAATSPGVSFVAPGSSNALIVPSL